MFQKFAYALTVALIATFVASSASADENDKFIWLKDVGAKEQIIRRHKCVFRSDTARLLSDVDKITTLGKGFDAAKTVSDLTSHSVPAQCVRTAMAGGKTIVILTVGTDGQKDTYGDFVLSDTSGIYAWRWYQKQMKTQITAVQWLDGRFADVGTLQKKVTRKHIPVITTSERFAQARRNCVSNNPMTDLELAAANHRIDDLSKPFTDDANVYTKNKKGTLAGSLYRIPQQCLSLARACSQRKGIDYGQCYLVLVVTTKDGDMILPPSNKFPAVVRIWHQFEKLNKTVIETVQVPNNNYTQFAAVNR